MNNQLSENKPLGIKSFLQINLDAFQEGSVSRKFNDLATVSYFSTILNQIEENNV